MRRRSYAYTPVELTDRMISELEERAAAYRMPDAHVAAIATLLKQQRFQPPVSRVVHVDDAVWVAREPKGRTSIRWYRFTPGDGATGYLELPAASQILAGRGDTVWIAEKDDLDVPYLTRYRF